MSSSIDRLSDDVICHILSFLPTRISVSTTSVLSKRWRFLWAHVPNLDFKGDDFKDQTRASVIIHRVMALHRAQTISTFRLFDDVSHSGYHMATCISHAVNLGVRNLYLEFTNPNFLVEYSFTPPRNLLTCNTLVDLKLRCCRVIISSSGSKVLLPSLKKLHLSRIMYKNDESLPRLISGCHVLEDLVVQDCFKDKRIVGDDLGCVFVFSPTIKTLNVDVLEGCRVLKINSPSLVYLKVNSCFLDDITSLGTMTSLIEAHFSSIRDYVEFKEHVDEIVKFLQGADNLQVLKCTLGGMTFTYGNPRLVQSHEHGISYKDCSN